MLGVKRNCPGDALEDILNAEDDVNDTGMKLVKVMIEATVENRLTLIERENLADIVAKQLADKLRWAATGVQWFSYIDKSMVGKEIGVSVLLGSKSLYDLNDVASPIADIDRTVNVLTNALEHSRISLEFAGILRATKLSICLDFACDETSRDVVLLTSNTNANTNNAVLKSSCRVLSTLTLLIWCIYVMS